MTSEVGEGAAVTRSGASKGILQAETVIAGFEFRFEGESRRHTLLSACPRCANRRHGSAANLTINCYIAMPVEEPSAASGAANITVCNNVSVPITSTQ